MSLGKREKPRVTGTRGDWDQTPDHRREKPAKKPPARQPLNPVSAKTAARTGERKAITVKRQRCALRHMGGCEGGIETHEIVRRGQMTESAYVFELTIGLCHTHHKMDTYRLEAERLGIRVPRHVYERDGVKAVMEANRLRSQKGLSIPYWWTDGAPVHGDGEPTTSG